MFKAIRWQTLPRDFLIIQVGFAMFGLSIAFLIRANLGTSPWVMLSVALNEITGLTVGTITVITGFVVLVGALLMREQIGWGTLGNIVFIGPWTDLFLWLVPAQLDSWWRQGLMLLAGILLLGLSTGIYISAQAGAGPRDSLMLAVQRTFGWNLRLARGGIEVLVFVVAWLLGGPAGIGTIIIALLIGPSVQWGFRLLGIQKESPTVAKAT